ncbi:hypothetical protein LPB90_18545 [Chryseobacterium sp. LC2016-29]|uniref:hypothetical protein n=1 Tax=Chryseobacterium sp. LC2016-29 TaxID=2897331 RepID=UPI001E5694EC|nr:hypothetical protein [Chryseobacterium sp. LC2016-29]MCD0480443.1 hypothetical protein [Chryseobacterium sp. LC2016-29]
MRILLLSAVIASQFLSAQIGKVGINTTNPQATIDMKIADVNLNGNTPEGLLIPRIGRERANNMGTTVEQSTMVYINTLDGTASGRVANVNKVGFYHFNGTEWIGLNNEKTPYDVTLTPSATSINLGESINLNVKSNIPSQFFYNSQNKGLLKKAAANNIAETISEFTVIGSEGIVLNPNGTDFFYTPTVLGPQQLVCYFYDSDKNLITKNIPIQVNGQIDDELIKINSHNRKPNDNYDSFTFQINSSGSTQYEFKIERASGAPYPYFEDTNTYGYFVFGQWYDYLNTPISIDMLKQTPGVNNIKIFARKKNSTIIEASKDVDFYRKLFTDFTEIKPLAKTLHLGESVELKLTSKPDYVTSFIADDEVYMERLNQMSTNLPIKIYSYSSSNTLIKTTFLDETGLSLPNSTYAGLTYGLSRSDSEVLSPGQVVKDIFEPLQVGTYILRFNLRKTDKILESVEREITVVLNVIP